MAVFWVVVPCSPVEVYQSFRGAFRLHHRSDRPTTNQKAAIFILAAVRTSDLILQYVSSHLIMQLHLYPSTYYITTYVGLITHNYPCKYSSVHPYIPLNVYPFQLNYYKTFIRNNVPTHQFRSRGVSDSIVSDYVLDDRNSIRDGGRGFFF
jgi:hypothetical protein